VLRAQAGVSEGESFVVLLSLCCCRCSLLLLAVPLVVSSLSFTESTFPLRSGRETALEKFLFRTFRISSSKVACAPAHFAALMTQSTSWYRKFDGKDNFKEQRQKKVKCQDLY